MHDQTANTTQILSVYRAEDFVVTTGVAEGDPLSFADELVMDDNYQLKTDARKLPLALTAAADGKSYLIVKTDDAETTGVAGRSVYLDSCLTLMARDSTTYEALVLVEVEDGGVEAIYLLPLARLAVRTDYQLVGLDRNAASVRFGEVAVVSFTRGTHITMASGEQRKIETLQPGDKVLTRDDGPRAIRWIGQSTSRAVGEFAPVRIRKGALHNENDLLLSPDHRILVYQRQDRIGAGRPEVLVKVRHLINGTTVVQQDGGFVDYFQLLFDEHHMIFAEGIATESLLIDPRTRKALPDEAGDKVSGGDTHAHRPHHDYEVQERLMLVPDAAELLRRASSS